MRESKRKRKKWEREEKRTQVSYYIGSRTELEKVERGKRKKRRGKGKKGKLQRIYNLRKRSCLYVLVYCLDCLSVWISMRWTSLGTVYMGLFRWFFFIFSLFFTFSVFIFALPSSCRTFHAFPEHAAPLSHLPGCSACSRWLSLWLLHGAIPTCFV